MSTRRVLLRLMAKIGAVFLATGLILATMSLAVAAQSGTGTGTGAGTRGGPYVILDGEFWKAMEKLSRAEANTYGDQQVPLLEKIALASQYMVKTNLTIIRQNDQIIHLLEELNRKRLQDTVK
jgi:ABC-type sugar transport system substrate-binding protein